MSQVIKDEIYDEHKHWIGTSYVDGNVWVLFTDYGTFAYRWHSTGSESLKHFIADTDADYLVRKLIPERQRLEIDWDASKKAIIKDILEARRGRDLDHEEARDKYICIKFSDCHEEYAYKDNLVDDWYELLLHKNTGMADAFYKVVIPRFKRLFTEQIQQKEAA